MNVLSLFDGMSCGLIAFTELGVPVDRYVAYEIDKYAIQTSKHNFPNVEQMGDVFKADFKQFEGFDMVIGGSPCTYWSIAQSADKREKTASGVGWGLFSQFVRALREAKPKFFLYENNKSMSKEIRMSITETFGFEPICINSALVSAQNRQRLYWVGKRNADGTYSKVDVKQPEDKGILPKDVLDNPIRFSRRDGLYQCKDKLLAICASDWRGINRNQMQNAVTEPVAEPIRVGALPRPNGELSTSQGMRIYGTEGKSVNLTAGGGGMGGKTGLYTIPVEFDNGTPTKTISCADGKTYTVYEVKNGLITVEGKRYPIKLDDGYYIIRKPTVSECKRLQTVPEWYEFPVSDTQAYKMLGNGWTVDVITHLLELILKEENHNGNNEEH